MKPWVKTSLAPGSKVVTDYLQASGLMSYLEKLKFHLVGYGCTTCIGNSGPLPEPISAAIKENNLVAVAVLSGNRNFEGRVHPLVRANYLASPPLVVAYALAGRMDHGPDHRILGNGFRTASQSTCETSGRRRRKWKPRVRAAVTTEQYRKEYSEVFEGDARWKAMPVPEGDLYKWDANSTYIKLPPFFENMPENPAALCGYSRRPRAGGAGRQRHHRPHFPGGLDHGGLRRRENI